MNIQFQPADTQKPALFPLPIPLFGSGERSGAFCINNPSRPPKLSGTGRTGAGGWVRKDILLSKLYNFYDKLAMSYKPFPSLFLFSGMGRGWGWGLLNFPTQLFIMKSL